MSRIKTDVTNTACSFVPFVAIRAIRVLPLVLLKVFSMFSAYSVTSVMKAVAAFGCGPEGALPSLSVFIPALRRFLDRENGLPTGGSEERKDC